MTARMEENSVPAPTVAEFNQRLNAYLAQGWTLHSIGGGAGEDWRELRLVFRRPPDALPCAFALAITKSIGGNDE